MIHFRIRYEQLRTRLEAGRRGSAVVRALSLALVPLVLAAPAWATGYLGPLPWLWPAASAIAFALAYARFSRPHSLAELGEMLDKRFRLDDLLVTAVEVDRRGPESPVEVHLLDDAASALARIERDPALEPRDKGRALEVLAGTVCILAGAWLLAAALGPGVRVARLPGLDAAGLGRVAGGADSTFEALADEGASDTRPATGQDALIGVRTAVPPPPPQPGSAGTDSHTPLPPPPPLPLGAVMTLQAPGASGAGAAAGPGGTLAQGDAPDDAVVGGGGAPGGGSAGGGLPTDHREVVRRYFSQP